MIFTFLIPIIRIISNTCHSYINIQYRGRCLQFLTYIIYHVRNCVSLDHTHIRLLITYELLLLIFIISHGVYPLRNVLREKIIIRAYITHLSNVYHDAHGCILHVYFNKTLFSIVQCHPQCHTFAWVFLCVNCVCKYSYWSCCSYLTKAMP